MANDRVGATNVVVLGTADSRSARAYERGALTFQPGVAPGDLVERTTGARWRVEEERLVESSTGRSLPRIGGHVVYCSAGTPSIPMPRCTAREPYGM